MRCFCDSEQHADDEHRRVVRPRPAAYAELATRVPTARSGGGPPRQDDAGPVESFRHLCLQGREAVHLRLASMGCDLYARGNYRKLAPYSKPLCRAINCYGWAAEPSAWPWRNPVRLFKVT